MNDDSLAQVPAEARESSSPAQEGTSNCTCKVSEESSLFAPHFDALQLTTAALPSECCLLTPSTCKPHSLNTESSERASLEDCACGSSQCSTSAPSALRICVHSQYDERISRLERERRASPLYDPDIHSPMLVLISPKPFAHSSE